MSRHQGRLTNGQNCIEIEIHTQIMTNFDSDDQWPQKLAVSTSLGAKVHTQPKVDLKMFVSRPKSRKIMYLS